MNYTIEHIQCASQQHILPDAIERQHKTMAAAALMERHIYFEEHNETSI